MPVLLVNQHQTAKFKIIFILCDTAVQAFDGSYYVSFDKPSVALWILKYTLLIVWLCKWVWHMTASSCCKTRLEHILIRCPHKLVDSNRCRLIQAVIHPLKASDDFTRFNSRHRGIQHTVNGHD